MFSSDISSYPRDQNGYRHVHDDHMAPRDNDYPRDPNGYRHVHDACGAHRDNDYPRDQSGLATNAVFCQYNYTVE